MTLLNQPSSELITRQADSYTARFMSGDIDQALIDEFERWCALNPLHRSAFDEAMDNWASLAPLSEDTEIQNLLIDDIQACAPRGRRWIKAPSLALAASFILAFGVLLGSFSTDDWGDEWMDDAGPIVASYSTDVGEQKTIVLSDNSIVRLNTDSRISVSYDNEARSISLINGEAFFDIQKDPKRPFYVDLGDRTISVIGTQFNVYRGADGLTVAVVEGVVALKNNDSEQAHNGAEDVDAYHLEAGAVIKIDGRNQKEITFGSIDEASRHADWTTGRVRFEELPLGDLVKEINRYIDREVSIADEELHSLNVNAVLDLDDVDTILTALQYSLPIQVTSDKDKVVIMSKNTQ